MSIEKTPRKYIRFYSLMTYLGRRSDKSPYKFRLDYQGDDGVERSTYLDIFPPFGESIKLIEDEQYMVLIRGKQGKALFDMISAVPKAQVLNRKIGTKYTVTVKNIISFEDPKFESYGIVKAVTDDIEFEGISYSEPQKGTVQVRLIPYMVPLLIDGKVTSDSYVERHDGITILKRIPGCLIRF